MKKLTVTVAMAALCAGGALADGSKMETRNFPVQESWFEFVANVASDAEPTGIVGKNDLFKPFFNLYGIEWPEGAAVKHNAASKLLTVRNTPENLDKVRDVLMKTGAQPIHIELQVLVLAASEKGLSSIGYFGPNRPSSEALMKSLLALNDTTMLGTSSVLCKSGVECETGAFKECRYPASYNVQLSNVVAPDDKSSQHEKVISAEPIAVAEPEQFIISDCGVRVRANPNWNPLLNTISVEMPCHVTGEPDWINYGAAFAKGKAVEFNLKQPTFPVLAKIDSSLVVRPGTTVAFTGGKIPSSNEQVFVFVTPRLVGVDGQPL